MFFGRTRVGFNCPTLDLPARFNLLDIDHTMSASQQPQNRNTLQSMPGELKEIILDFLVPKPDILTVDNKSYLSLESFASVEPGAPSESDNNLSNFVCWLHDFSNAHS